MWVLDIELWSSGLAVKCLYLPSPNADPSCGCEMTNHWLVRLHQNHGYLGIGQGHSASSHVKMLVKALAIETDENTSYGNLPQLW